ncbi:MAG: hypothetical protein RBU23_09410 [Candidatus Auribacterota bacterium]|nr:hypothetical protein [Candidatus Auribacterota bacterium]
MTYQDALKITVENLEEIQSISGFEKVPINENTIPIGDIPGFDSLNGVEFASMIDKVVNIGKIVNFCASKDGKIALTVHDIAKRILEETSIREK